MNAQRIGQRRHRITLMREYYDKGAGGRLVLTTPVIAEVWASIDEQTSGLGETAEQQKSPTLLTVQTHYDRHLMAAQRLKFAGDIYRITKKRKCGVLMPILEITAQSAAQTLGGN